MRPLAEELQTLNEWIARLPRIGMEALGGGGAPLFVLDFIVIGAVKRSMSLSSALALLVPAKNAVLSRAVLRMEIDTLARLLAYTYVASPQDVAQAVIGGRPLRDFKSKDGKQLTDRYLVDRLCEHLEWARRVYDSTSGDIHFSEKQFFDSVHSLGEKGERTFTLQVSQVDDRYPESTWTEIVACFNEMMGMLEHKLSQYGASKPAAAPEAK